MALAVTHIILTIVVIDLYRDYIAKKKFPTKYVLIGGIAGLLPDLDIPFGWIYNLATGSTASFHGTFTHSMLIPMALAVAAALVFKAKRKSKVWMLLAVTAFGWFFHLVLDCFFNPYRLFLPFLATACPFNVSQELVIGLDAVILLAWLIHEEWAHRIRDYI